jgi:hypothetical protein
MSDTPIGAPPQKDKVRGIADIVFLLDVTGSMAHCIAAVKNNIANFLSVLTVKDANNEAPVKEWRAKAVGYRDYTCDAVPLEDNPFVSTEAELRAQLDGLKASGGGDIPESCLDALQVIINMENTPKGAQVLDPMKWRYRSEAARCVVLFTDANFHPSMSVEKYKGGTVADVQNSLASQRIRLSIFAPDFPDLHELSKADKCEYNTIDGDSPQEALEEYTKDIKNFEETMKAIAKSITQSANTDTEVL